jgi:hypothetical protein
MMDESLVPFPRLGLRLLGAPSKFPHHPPDMSGMIANPGSASDDRGDPGQAPQIGVEAIGAGAFEKSRLDFFELGRGESRLSPGAAGGGQSFFAALSPGVKPNADGLAGHTQLSSNFGLGYALIEELGCGETPPFHAGKITPGPVLLRGFCFHAYIVTWKMELSTYYARISNMAWKRPRVFEFIY